MPELAKPISMSFFLSVFLSFFLSFFLFPEKVGWVLVCVQVTFFDWNGGETTNHKTLDYFADTNLFFWTHFICFILQRWYCFVHYKYLLCLKLVKKCWTKELFGWSKNWKRYHSKKVIASSIFNKKPMLIVPKSCGAQKWG